MNLENSNYNGNIATMNVCGCVITSVALCRRYYIRRGLLVVRTIVMGIPEPIDAGRAIKLVPLFLCLDLN